MKNDHTNGTSNPDTVGDDFLLQLQQDGCSVLEPSYPRATWEEDDTTDDHPPKVDCSAAAGVDTAKEPGFDTSLLSPGFAVTPQLPLAAFGQWASWISHAAEHAGCPEDYVAGTLLTGAATAIGNSRQVCGESSGWFEQPSILWVALVGRPSSGKSPGMRAVKASLQHLQLEDIRQYELNMISTKEQQETASAHEKNWRQAVDNAVKTSTEAPPRPPESYGPKDLAVPVLVIQDSTPEAVTSIASGNPRGLIQIRDELAGLLSSFDRYNGSGSERAMYLEAYDGGDYTFSRKSGGTVVIPRLSISMCGGLQPDKFRSLLNNGDDDGLQSRFLYMYPERRSFHGRPASQTDQIRLNDALARLRSLQGEQDDGVMQPIKVPLGDLGATRFEQWMIDEDSRVASDETRIAAWRGKSPGRVLRLALVLHYLEWAFHGDGAAPDTISLTTVERAISLHHYFLGMAVKTFGEASMTEQESACRILARWLASSHMHGKSDISPMATISIRQIYKQYRVPGLRSPQAARAAVEQLLDAGWLTSPDTPQSLGRKSDAFRVRPEVIAWLQSRDGTAGAREASQMSQKGQKSQTT